MAARDEYVLVGCHYDHLSFCAPAENADNNEVCNGATDNAAGVAAVLGIGRAMAALPDPPPRRSVVLTFWDAEEDGLQGSAAYTMAPLVPLEKTVTYVNFDIMGANLVPSLRDFSFAVAFNSGGPALEGALANAVANEGLDMRSVSRILGNDGSDHVSFLDSNVASVFFGDSTGGCYHTAGDEIKTVDFGKLEKQARIGLKLVYELASTTAPPRFNPLTLPIRFEDAIVINDAINSVVENDLDLVDTETQAELMDLQSRLNVVVFAGPLLFPLFIIDFGTALLDAVSILRTTKCDGYVLAED